MPFDPRAITAKIPGILFKPDPKAAFALAIKHRFKDAVLPEVMTLFGTQGLSAQDKQQMLSACFSGDFDGTESATLSNLNGDLGRIGFSFPQWRYLTQCFNGATLVERFGMEKLSRATDVQNPALPKSDPARDLFGAGFAIQTDRHYIEYRRAYILCSTLDHEKPASLMIRNNSYFFGRDRLPQPVYVSFEPQTKEDLQGLTLPIKGFQGWKEFLANVDGRTEKLQQLSALVEAIDTFDGRLSAWLLADGREDFLEFLKQPRNAPLYVAGIEGKGPPWYPRLSIPVSDQNVDMIKLAELPEQLKCDSLKLVLLSGAAGDFPVTPRP